LHADKREEQLGHEYLGVGVGGAQIELQVGYADAAAVWNVDPQLSYTPRLMQSARPTPVNSELKLVTRRTFHEAMFALNADAE
jgi:hypothetical protein